MISACIHVGCVPFTPRGVIVTHPALIHVRLILYDDSGPDRTEKRISLIPFPTGMLNWVNRFIDKFDSKDQLVQESDDTSLMNREALEKIMTCFSVCWIQKTCISEEVIKELYSHSP